VRRRRRIIIGLAQVALAALLGAPVASAAIVMGGDGTQNTDAPPGSTYWNNLGYTGFGSGVYLGEGWVLTAGHVHGGVSSSFGFTVPKLDNGNDVTFNATPNAFASLHTTAGGPYADLVVFRLDDDPRLQLMSPVRLGPTPQVGTNITMTGSGLNRQAPLHHWRVSGSNKPEEALWTDVTGLPSENTANFHGYVYGPSSRTPKRWGTNVTVGFEGNAPTLLYEPKDANGNVVQQTVLFAADFDAINGEAQVVDQDSGGGVFAGNRLIGINLLKGDWTYPDSPNPNGLGQPAKTAVFGNSSYFANVFTYVDQIASITKVHPGLDGDANLDGVVDINDFHSFYASLNTAAGWTHGDFNLDGQVNFLDYQILQRFWGQSDGLAAPAVTPLPALTEVPEPGGLVIIGAGILALGGRRRRR
jgi:hypothetical protein